MHELAEARRTQLLRDLEGFADRGVTPVVERTDSTLHATWVCRGEERSEMFGLDPEGVLRWVSGPSGDDPYGEFLTGSGMGEFEQLAQAITRSIEPRQDFVASQALVESGVDDLDEITADATTVAELAGTARRQAEGRTSLFFVKGDPGVGKTTLLREATHAQASRFLAGESPYLFLFVSAQGRELSNLRDAFSGELDDLRAGFTRDAVATFVRAGLLVPIVDGFDELLGTAGYSGAFSSLQSLLVQLEGLGAVVVSARSSFYDLEFLGRSSNPVDQADLSTTTIELEPWTDEELASYLAKVGNDKGLDVIELLSESDRKLLRRPFFASQYAGFAAARGDDQDLDLLGYLITAYIKREAAKIVDSTGDPVLPIDGHHRFFELTAGEMWEGETRQLSIEDLRILTTLVADEFSLGADEAEQLRTKITSYAGFASGRTGSQEEFSFEHEVYFDYFLARAARRLLDSGPSFELDKFLDRGVVPEVVAEGAVRDLEQKLSTELLRCPEGLEYENRRRNLGVMVVTFAREKDPVVGCTVQGLTFSDVAFGSARFEKVEFMNCLFVNVDLREASFESCTASTSQFDALDLTEVSSLGIEGLQAGRNVNRVRHPATGDLYAPSVVQELLTKLGVPAPAEKAPQYSDRAVATVALLHKLARAYGRTNILYETDGTMTQVFRSAEWPDLRRSLVKHGVVTEEVRAASGPKTKAFRIRVSVDQLLRGQYGKLGDGPIDALWRELRSMK